MASIGAVVVILAGLLLDWLSVRMWRERLPRNAVAGVRTRSTMRSDEAFRVANKAAAPLSGAGGAALVAGGLAAVFLPRPAAPAALLAGALACGALCVAGGVKGIRACR